MGELIQEPIAVETALTKHAIMPSRIVWRQRTYHCVDCGMHYSKHEGNTLLHIFYMTTQEACMQITLNTETLRWTLMEIEAI